MLYLLDTNILVHMVREDTLAAHLRAKYGLLTREPTPLISVVTVGEVRSLAYQFTWGEVRVDQALFLLDYFGHVEVDSPEVLRNYAVMDADSRRRGVRMGKNDLWIAAAARKTGATLLTTDADFDHLNGRFFPVERIDAERA